MKSISTLTILFIFCILTLSVQESSGQKRINAKGAYSHPQAKIIFPEQLDIYPRMDIYAFDAKRTDIGAVYKNKSSRTEISVYVYPAGDGYEGRLRTEYQKSMQSIALVSHVGVHATQFAVRHEGEKFICNGFKAVIRDQNSLYNALTVYECGEWFLKVRVTSTELDSAKVVALEQIIYTHFDPTKLTEINPLNEQADVNFSKTAFRDSVLLGSAMGSAYKKIEWASENVRENERASGFPDLYLDMHVASLKAFLEFQHRAKYTMTNPTKKYLDNLQVISDAGFLSEFVMDQFGMILILPDNILANYEDYLDWKQSQKITVDLNQVFYLISYGQKNGGKKRR